MFMVVWMVSVGCLILAVVLLAGVLHFVISLCLPFSLYQLELQGRVKPQPVGNARAEGEERHFKVVTFKTWPALLGPLRSWVSSAC